MLVNTRSRRRKGDPPAECDRNEIGRPRNHQEEEELGALNLSTCSSTIDHVVIKVRFETVPSAGEVLAWPFLSSTYASSDQDWVHVLRP